MNEPIQMKEFEKDFYAQLGILSVKFSKLDYFLSVILELLLGTGDSTISLTLIENNNIAKNIDLIRKINRIRHYEENKISNLLDQVDNIKGDRNLFIHGIWSPPLESEDGISMICQARKIKYSLKKDKKGIVIRSEWRFNENYVFSLPQIKEKIIKIDEVLLILHNIIEKLDMDALQGFEK